MKKVIYILIFSHLALYGQGDYSISFDGQNDYVEVNNIGTLENFTLSCRFSTSISPSDNFVYWSSTERISNSGHAFILYPDGHTDWTGKGGAF